METTDVKIAVPAGVPRNWMNLCTKAHESDAGIDLPAYLEDNDSTRLSPREEVTIRTGLIIQVPKGHAGVIYGRSSLMKRGLLFVHPVIDEGYTGELLISIHNMSTSVVNISFGQRIAQLVLFPVPRVRLLKCDISSLDPSSRGSDGFGSSGR